MTRPSSPLSMLLSRHTRRRGFITLIGGALASPVAAQAQQPGMPTIGFLNITSADEFAPRLRAFRDGLKASGYVEGENVRIDFRWADNRGERLPDLAVDLVRKQVSILVATGGSLPALAVKAATKTIPIVFGTPEDPARIGLVETLSRPGGNATGVNFFTAELVAKRLGLLRELLPGARRVALLVDRSNAALMRSTVQELQDAANAVALQTGVVEAANGREIDTAFGILARERFDALFIGPGPLFVARRVQLATLAARHALPTMFSVRDNVEAGGLMSYGTNVNEAYHQIGEYTGRILRGAKPVDLPVLQSTKFELVINAQTARLLQLDVPPTLLARADEECSARWTTVAQSRQRLASYEVRRRAPRRRPMAEPPRMP